MKEDKNKAHHCCYSIHHPLLTSHHCRYHLRTYFSAARHSIRHSIRHLTSILLGTLTSTVSGEQSRGALLIPRRVAYVLE